MLKEPSPLLRKLWRHPVVCIQFNFTFHHLQSSFPWNASARNVLDQELFVENVMYIFDSPIYIYDSGSTIFGYQALSKRKIDKDIA